MKPSVKMQPEKLEDVRAALAQIAENAGNQLNPEDVVEAAGAPGHPLHSYFVWDDKEAGSCFRLAQAQYLIRTVKLEVTRLHHAPRPLALTLTRVSPEERPPVSAAREACSPVDDALRDLHGVLARHRKVEELEELWETITRLTDKVKLSIAQAGALERDVVRLLSKGAVNAEELRRRICPGWDPPQMNLLLHRLSARGLIKSGSPYPGERTPRWHLVMEEARGSYEQRTQEG
jgi:hypothetical protein